MICDKFEKCCENIAGKPLLKKRVFPHPFPKNFWVGGGGVGEGIFMPKNYHVKEKHGFCHA